MAIGVFVPEGVALVAERLKMGWKPEGDNPANGCRLDLIVDGTIGEPSKWADTHPLASLHPHQAFAVTCWDRCQMVQFHVGVTLPPDRHQPAHMTKALMLCGPRLDWCPRIVNFKNEGAGSFTSDPVPPSWGEPSWEELHAQRDNQRDSLWLERQHEQIRRIVRDELQANEYGTTDPFNQVVSLRTLDENKMARLLRDVRRVAEAKAVRPPMEPMLELTIKAGGRKWLVAALNILQVFTVQAGDATGVVVDGDEDEAHTIVTESEATIRHMLRAVGRQIIGPEAVAGKDASPYVDPAAKVVATG